jgi:hypothetical protein
VDAAHGRRIKKSTVSVIPAKAGIQIVTKSLDPGVRRGDECLEGDPRQPDHHSKVIPMQAGIQEQITWMPDQVRHDGSSI